MADLKKHFEKLQETSHKLSSEMYKKNAGGTAPQGDAGGEKTQAGGETKNGDDVIDADYKDVN